MIQFHKTVKSALAKSKHLCFLAPESAYKKGTYQKILNETFWQNLDGELKKAEAGSGGTSIDSYTLDSNIRTISFGVLPDKVSRCNSPTRKEAIYQNSASVENHEQSAIIVVLESKEHYGAAATALARRLRLFSQKSSAKKKRVFHMIAVDTEGALITADAKVESLVSGVAWACKAVDTPPSVYNPKGLAAEIKTLFKNQEQVTIKEIKGDKLKEQKLNGIYAVGQCADEKPRMLVLEYKPSKPKKTVALVGKGVTYDTGGLSLKISGGMVNMKMDMGGAAAVIGAFSSLVAAKSKARVIAIVGLVENAIGPAAYKNDDIISMHSGKTVEINNTDAEGRLVLADCVSYACRKYKLDLVVDAATLTGAQLVATGNLHAAVVSNQDEMEGLAVAAGKASGDLVAPLPFAPEFYKSEFSSKVADMRNSVKNRANAQSSCAAQFIYNHIEDTDTPWVHVDLAGPASIEGLGTGFGVALMATMVDKLSS